MDFELRGCPVDRPQLLEVLTAFLRGRRPNIRTHSVCIECKRRGNVCVMVARGTGCLGPVTQMGCGAICPAFARGCYGCFGPMETPNTQSLSAALARGGMDNHTLMRLFRTFNATAPAFEAASRARESREGGL